ncbi:MAG: Ig-like domain-containing protein [Leptospiraceae bacterium]|nr:Ig-like domain-containing protein [Leptospiraceae bacterium]MCP5499808.1 Ig-like domain-containing protein [Leptospiraceae bacterium]
MKRLVYLLLIFFTSCAPGINFNNPFEPSPGLFLHYLWLQKDKTPPEVNYTTPYNYETNYSRNRSILIVYDEPILSESVKENTLQVFHATTQVPGKLEVNRNTLKFIPTEYYAANSLHTVKLQKSVKDLAGNVQPVFKEDVFYFTTGNDIDTEPPILKTSTPLNASTDTFILKQGDTVIETEISSYGSVVQIQLPKPGVGFQPVVGFQPNTTYALLITTGIKDLSGNALASEQTISFTTTDTSDRTPPVIETVIPADGSTNVSNNTLITVNFSEAIDVNTLNTSSFYIEEIFEDGSIKKVPGAVSGEGRSLIFRVNESFRTSTKHQITLMGTIKDLSGNAMGTNKTYNFTTGRLVTYTVGGTVSGLSGTLILQNNGGDELTLTSDGSLTFTTGVSSYYSVTAKTQPTGQTCTVSNGNGTASANVSNISVSCVTSAFPISGNLSGMGSGKNIVLQLNSGSDLTLNSNGSFTFGTNINYNNSYAVTVKTNPSTQTCTILNATGTATANVSNITVSCNPYMESKTWYVDNKDGTIYDKSTGLIWLKCSQGQTWNENTNSCDGTAVKYRYCDVNNNSCNSDASGNPPYTLNGTGTSEAYTQCNNLNSNPPAGFAGRTNWRVPSVTELETLLDLSGQNYSSTGALNNGNLFPNTIAGFYWSSTTYAPNTTSALLVGFVTGYVHSVSKTFDGYVRCVSGP